MTISICKLCNFTTTHLPNYKRHLLTDKHKKNECNAKETKCHPVVILKEHKCHPVEQKEQKDKEYLCKYCEQEFSSRQSMHRHIKYRCTKNKDEDIKELVRLLNIQLQEKDKQLEQKDKQLEINKKQIDKLSSKLEININTTNIQNNFTLLPYDKTDYSHLTDKDYVSALKKVNFCVKHLIERVHFNPEKPENMNIYISNIKDKYLMMYENGAWNIKQKDYEIGEFLIDKELKLEEWLDKEQHKYPDLRDKFQRYIDNKENNEILNSIKDEIKLLLYNKKNMITNG